MRYFLFLAAGLAGCTPNAANYYRPSVEGGQIVTGRCVPLPSRTEFTIDYVRITAFVNEVRGQQFVSLHINPFPMQTVRFVSERFELRDIMQGKPIPVASVTVFRHDRENALTESYPKKDAALAARPYFNVLVYMGDQSAEAFELHSPSILVDGEERRFPVIRFKRETWVGISPVNC